MTVQNALHNLMPYLTLPQNGSAPSPDSGGVFAVSGGDRPYFNNTTATYGLPLLTNGGGGADEGDMIIGNAAGSFDLVNIGGGGQIWTSNATTASWQDPANWAATIAGQNVNMGTYALNNVNYLTVNTSAVTEGPATGGIYGVNGAALPYFVNTTDVFGMPLINNGGAAPSDQDLIVGNGGDTYSLLTVGADDTVLTVTGGNVSWAAPAASPGLATFLCQTSTNLPANGVDVSNPANIITFGTTQAALDAYWQGAPFTVYSTNGGFASAMLVEGGSSNYYWGTYSGASDNFGTAFAFQSSRGSMASPLPNINGNVLARLSVNGQTGTAIDATSECANIRFVAEDNFATNPSCGIHFFTQQTAVGGLLERVKIDKTGLLTASFGISSTALTLTTTPLAATSGGTSTATYATGDTLYASASNVLSKLSVGSTGNVLTVAGGVPTWAAPATSGTVTSVGLTSTGSTITITGATSPITASGTYNIELTDTYAPIVSGGAADTVGLATALVGGANVITTTTAIAASSIVMVSISSVAGAPTTATQVACATANNVAGTSFQIDVILGAGATSADVNWQIINP